MAEEIKGQCVRCAVDADVYFCGQPWCFKCRMDFWLEKPERMEAVIKFVTERGRVTPVERLNKIIDQYENRHKRYRARARERLRLQRERYDGFGLGHDAGSGSGSDTTGGWS